MGRSAARFLRGPAIVCNLLTSELAANFFHHVSIESAAEIRDYPLLAVSFSAAALQASSSVPYNPVIGTAMKMTDSFGNRSRTIRYLFFQMPTFASGCIWITCSLAFMIRFPARPHQTLHPRARLARRAATERADKLSWRRS